MMEGVDEAHIEIQGNLGAPGVTELSSTPVYETLDEPVSVTLWRDVQTVGWKFCHVLMPKSDSSLLRDWDLWGPLILCVTLALLVRQGAADDQKTLVFTSVFFIIWFGSVVVTINSQLLGGTLSFFQSLCVLGYCILPPVLAAFINILLSAFGITFWLVHFLLVALGCVWAVYASLGFLADSQPPRRKALAVYPLVLFYIVISWMVLLQPLP